MLKVRVFNVYLFVHLVCHSLVPRLFLVEAGRGNEPGYEAKFAKGWLCIPTFLPRAIFSMLYLPSYLCRWRYWHPRSLDGNEVTSTPPGWINLLLLHSPLVFLICAHLWVSWPGWRGCTLLPGRRRERFWRDCGQTTRVCSASST